MRGRRLGRPAAASTKPLWGPARTPGASHGPPIPPLAALIDPFNRHRVHGGWICGSDAILALSLRFRNGRGAPSRPRALRGKAGREFGGPRHLSFHAERENGPSGPRGWQKRGFPITATTADGRPFRELGDSHILAAAGLSSEVRGESSGLRDPVWISRRPVFLYVSEPGAPERPCHFASTEKRRMGSLSYAGCRRNAGGSFPPALPPSGSRGAGRSSLANQSALGGVLRVPHR